MLVGCFFVGTVAGTVVGSLVDFGSAGQSGVAKSAQADPCAAIAGQVWVSPEAVRACFESFPVEPEIKANVRYNPIERRNIAQKRFRQADHRSCE